MAEKSDHALVGRTAIVTGGMRGIGWAVAQGFAGRGANVVIVDRDVADAAEVAAARRTIEAAGAALLYLQADVTNEAEVRSFVARVADRFGTVDALVNNVGVGAPPKPIEQVSLEEWTKVVNQNILSTFSRSRRRRSSKAIASQHQARNRILLCHPA
jgi:3-oxoacyl-[acyl-carrier protein] reductase